MIRKIRKIGLFFGLLIAVLLMSNPMFICRGDDDPPQFEVGDLLFMDFKGDFDLTVGLYNDHVALFVGTHPTEPGNDWFIDAGWGGVDYTKFSTFEAGKENFLIAQVKDIELEDIEDAVQWARGRIGDEYQFYWPLNWSVRKWNDPDNPDPKDPPGYARHDKWYCTEFVWAAYYNYPVEIDIDNNEWCERLFGQPCVNIGCMGNRSMPEWMIEYICPYIFKNEILIDDDINVTWKEKGIYGFPAGTQIQLESGGTANIENVRVEDFVVSFDERQNQTIAAQVTNVYCYTPTEAPDEFILINDDILVSTDHVLYINNWWVRAEDAQVGDKLLSYIDSGPQMITINATESEYHNVSCYALELESSLGALASYFADGILVCE